MIPLDKIENGVKVRRIQDSCNPFYKVGSVYVIGTRLYLDSVHPDTVKRFPEHWELAKENKMFDMSNKPWYIKVNSAQEFEVINAWLKESFGTGLVCGFSVGMKYLTNVDSGDLYDNRVMWGAFEPHHSCEEIKLHFKTTVAYVEYPEEKTEEQKEIERLTAIINEAQESLGKLKGN